MPFPCCKGMPSDAANKQAACRLELLSCCHAIVASISRKLVTYHAGNHILNVSFAAGQLCLAIRNLPFGACATLVSDLQHALQLVPFPIGLAISQLFRKRCKVGGGVVHLLGLVAQARQLLTPLCQQCSIL